MKTNNEKVIELIRLMLKCDSKTYYRLVDRALEDTIHATLEDAFYEMLNNRDINQDIGLDVFNSDGEIIDEYIKPERQSRLFQNPTDRTKRSPFATDIEKAHKVYLALRQAEVWK